MNTPNVNRKKKKNSGGGLVVLGIYIAYLLLSRVNWHSIGRSFRGGDRAVLFGALALVLLAVIVIKLRKKAAERKNDSPAAAAHTHDRLQGYTAGACSAEEHWRKQLDSFLAAGIIDRAEYRVLLERYRRSYGQQG